MHTTENADPAELAKFSDLAHRWWDTESEFRPLHQINPLRLGWIEGLAPLQVATVLSFLQQLLLRLLPPQFLPSQLLLRR